ncbi:MAG: septation protein SpoVG family protein [Candidatus Omnitrophota bacterium]|nr:septation protein SpoVG family protein [Candidatus Omnitrophota bacterium]
MEKIIITEPTFIPLKPNDKGLIGIASVVYNNSLSLNCISVYSRPNGDLRLVFPIKVLPNSKEINVYYPINKETYEAIRKAIVDKYLEITVSIADS